MAKGLRFTVGGAVYHADLKDIPLAENIAAMCPFELDYSRGGDHEYYASLPEKASAKGCESTTKGRRNGLYFFESWNALSLVFHDCDTAPWQIHHIGGFEDGMSAALEKADGRIRILCEAE